MSLGLELMIREEVKKWFIETHEQSGEFDALDASDILTEEFSEILTADLIEAIVQEEWWGDCQWMSKEKSAYWDRLNLLESEAMFGPLDIM